MPADSSSPSRPANAAHPYAAARRPNGATAATGTATASTHSASAAARRDSQPKSTRQQFAACGACRMRRVKCDLKDVNPRPGETPMCTNCQERGLKCVDEFANVKAVKLLRRGRRLAQVEQVYGPAAQARADAPSTDAEGAAQASSSRTPSCIPKLQPEFFGSPFYRRFHIQRPIVDPTEFSARFYESEQGKPESLGVAGSMICMLLVTWAATYGVNEYGVEEPSNGLEGVRERRRRCNEMVREILGLIDKHGLLRKPTWDGVRVLLLIMPLTEDVQTQLERLAMYEATVSQVYTLCSLGSLVKSGQGEFVDALVRARIFWYGHVHEGITSGLRGGRLIFEDDDLSSFQITFPSLGNKQSLIRTSITYSYSYRYATAPIRLSSACRQIHAALTGPKAKRKEDVNEPGLKEAWEALSRSWEEFEGLRHVGPVGIIQTEDTERFVNGWQIFIFECHNIIRESLKQRMIEHRRTRDAAFIVDPDVSHEPLLAKLTRLHSIAEGKCQDVAGQIVTLIRRHLGSSFFQYDASLVRDGCFYAGLCLARDSGTEEDIRTCVQALEEMRWAFSKSEERIATLKWAWENRKVDEEERLWSERLVRPDSAPGGGGDATGYGGGMGNPVDGMMRTNSDPTSGMMRNGGEANGNSGRNLHRPPTLTLVEGATVDAAPLTSVSDGSWHTPSSASDLAHSHHNSPSSGPATIMPDKTLMMEPALMNAYPTAHTEMFAGAFTDTTAAGHYADDTPIYGHSMPTHGMGVGMGMGMGAHGMQGTYAHGGAALPSFSAPHYDYYPHSNTSHR
ncbi:Fungal Zn(2)-Cys(6) binuclear cluster domain [Rhizoctonia solani]|uniref:Fungal Zn(2)-Cys(6) binuclear cluster domain n=1 Tax=Rhizoctonia solani TaxID=456999 RepID=A0A8H8NRZ0_9AGAM|nr:Fungal Zn(2)-Cys(6) binuclear cluster domain [Rhizoctonia solani]QRW17673.1 Fungal Zn(2)-Cys(6) binuclear cluster domain [Rhizoctonia solani]